MKNIKSEGILIISYEPALENGGEFFHSQVINDLYRIKSDSDVILANRFDSHILGDAKDKVFTKNLFRRD